MASTAARLASKWHEHGPVAHRLGQGLRLLGSDDNLDPQTSRRGQEVRGPVGARGQQQEDPGHSPMMVSSSDC